jgi:hypothetical protein
MNLIWHLAKKDFHRAWIPTALFAAFVIAKLWLAALVLGDLDLDRYYDLRFYLNFLEFGGGVMGYVLIAAVVQEDPVVGSKAFWMTKPLSGPRLLGVKLVVLAVTLVLLPLLIVVPWWIICGFPLADLPAAIPRNVLPQLLLLLVGLPFAALTRNLTHYLTSSLVVLLSSVLLIKNFVKPFASADTLGLTLPAGAADTRGTIVTAILLCTAFAVVLYQYRTRATPRSLAILGVGAGLAMLTFAAWRWDWSPLWKTSSPPSSLVADLKLEFRSVQIVTLPSPPVPHLSLRAELSGVPAGHVLGGVFTRQEWRSPDGTKMVFGTKGSSFVEPGPELRPLLDLDSKSDTTRGPNLAEAGSNPAPSVKEINSIVRVPEEQAHVITVQPLELAFTVTTKLLRPALLAETELKPIASHASSDRRLRVLNVRGGANGEITVSTLLIALSGQPTHADRPKLILFNRTTDLLLPSISHHAENLNIAGVSITAHTATFNPPAAFNKGSTTSDVARAREDFRLALVAYDVVADVNRTVEVPDVSVHTP